MVTLPSQGFVESIGPAIEQQLPMPVMTYGDAF